MKHYELFYIASGAVPETSLATLQKEVSGWVTEAGGTLVKEELWGRKKFTHPINKERSGFYVLLDFDTESDRIRPLEQKLKLHKSILRHLLLQREPLSAKALHEQEVARKHAQARRVQAMTERADADREKKTEPKISLEELDKKLDELLDQDIVS